MTTHSKIGYAVGWVGILWTLATLSLEAVLHLRGLPHMPTHWLYLSVGVGIGFGWWGFFWANGKRAKEGGTFIMDARDRLQEPFHAHRRATDAAPDAEVIAVAPAPAQPVAPLPDATNAIQTALNAAGADPTVPVGQHVAGEGD
jgi:hypothetical protein